MKNYFNKQERQDLLTLEAARRIGESKNKEIAG